MRPAAARGSAERERQPRPSNKRQPQRKSFSSRYQLLAGRGGKSSLFTYVLEITRDVSQGRSPATRPCYSPPFLPLLDADPVLSASLLRGRLFVAAAAATPYLVGRCHGPTTVPPIAHKSPPLRGSLYGSAKETAPPRLLGQPVESGPGAPTTKGGPQLQSSPG